MSLSKPPSFGGAILLSIPFIGIGVFMFLTTINTLLEWYPARQWVETSAYILEAKLTNNELEVHYRYTFNNKTYRNTRVSFETTSVRVGSNPSNFQVMHRQLERYLQKNKPFHCYVNPMNPTEAILYRNMPLSSITAKSFLGVIFGSLGSVFLAGSLVQFMLYRKGTNNGSSKLVQKHSHKSEQTNSNKIEVIVHHPTLIRVNEIVFTVTWNILSFPIWIILYLGEGYNGIPWIAIYPSIGLLLIGITVYNLLRRRIGRAH